MRVRWWLVSVAVGSNLAVSALVAPPAVAQVSSPDREPQDQDEAADTDTPEDPEAARKARRYFRKGMKHFDDRAYRPAIRAFRLAAQNVPSADLWFNIARAHEELGEYEPAIKYYRRYLRDRVDPPDRQEVEKHISRLEKRLKKQREQARKRPTTGSLRIRSDTDAARVAVDGKAVGQTPLDLPLDLTPGDHHVEISKEGHVPFHARVTVDAGVHTGVYATMSPKTAYETVGGTRIWTWITGILAAGAFATAAGYGIKALTYGDDQFRDARRDAKFSDYALGAGFGLGLTTGVLWFVEGRSTKTEEKPAPRAAGGGRGPAF